MIRINLKEAEGHLGELIEEAASGQEVVITSDSGPSVRLMLVPPKGQESQGFSEPTQTVGHALDRFIGTWSAEQEAEVLKAVEIFEQVDESFWQ
jgi:prevent-host-death family protein